MEPKRSVWNLKSSSERTLQESWRCHWQVHSQYQHLQMVWIYVKVRSLHWAWKLRRPGWSRVRNRNLRQYAPALRARATRPRYAARATPPALRRPRYAPALRARANWPASGSRSTTTTPRTTTTTRSGPTRTMCVRWDPEGYFGVQEARARIARTPREQRGGARVTFFFPLFLQQLPIQNPGWRCLNTGHATSVPQFVRFDRFLVSSLSGFGLRVFRFSGFGS